MNNSIKNIRILKAQETLQIIERGNYTVNNLEININQQIKQSVDSTVLYSPDSFKQIMNDAEQEIAGRNRKEEILLAEQTMLSRIDKILSVFVMHKVDNLILGAWGCGVFQNNPEDVARYFAHYLKEGGKYINYFQTIVFAVFDKSINQENMTAFSKVFE